MNVLLLGSGAVGEAYAKLISQADPQGEWVPILVIADYSLERARAVGQRLDNPDRFPAMRIDAGNAVEIQEVLKQYRIDLLMNGCPQHLNPPIFDSAFEVGCHYMDMAMTLSERHPAEPYCKVGVLLGDYQYARHDQWRAKGQLALLGMGIDPGVSEVFARYAEQTLFDEIDRIQIRDGSNMTVTGHAYATQFSVWSVIEECLNPPVFWERDKGYYTGKAMSRSEVFDFPEGIGPLEVVAIEHEEVINLPRWIDKGLREVDFKISLGRELMAALRVLEGMGLASADPLQVKGVQVAPRDVVEACMPDPCDIGPRMTGKICVGTLITGRKAGRPRETYLYQVCDNQVCMQRWECQAVAIQTAAGPAIATELLARGIWQGSGVLPPEAFDPVPFLERMAPYGFPYGIRDRFETSEQPEKPDSHAQNTINPAP